MLGADGAVVGAKNPGFEVGKQEVDHGQVGVELLRIAGNFEGFVAVVIAGQGFITFGVVGADDCAFCHTVIDEGNQFQSTTAGDNAQAEPAGIDQFLEGYAIGMILPVSGGAGFGIFARTDFNGASNDGFVVGATNKAFIGFHGILTAKAFPIWPDHARPEFVEDLEGGFIAAEAELALKLQG